MWFNKIIYIISYSINNIKELKRVKYKEVEYKVSYFFILSSLNNKISLSLKVDFIFLGNNMVLSLSFFIKIEVFNKSHLIIIKSLLNF
jgi:hypothetical protein